jgi:2,3-dihydroxybenzoate decarboxylase
MEGKIALEEAFLLPGFGDYGPGFRPGGHRPERLEQTKRRIYDVEEERLEAMDKAGIELSVLSFTAPGVQGEPDARRAVELARRLNDELAAIVARHPGRYAGFASLPLQDPEAAAAELDRAVRELGFVGAIVNGFTNLGDEETALYYDDLRFEPFWSQLEALGVPVYLHPRMGVPSQQRVYDGHPELLGAAWAFGVDTATHVLRLVSGGVFDRHPRARLILGHLAELLPFAIWRLGYWLVERSCGIELEHEAAYYLRHNLYATTSGFFATRPLQLTLEEMGVDRVLFSVDYPYNDTLEASSWFDAAEIDEATRTMVGRANAVRLLGLDLPEADGSPRGAAT